MVKWEHSGFSPVHTQGCTGLSPEAKTGMMRESGALGRGLGCGGIHPMSQKAEQKCGGDVCKMERRAQ